MVDASVAVMLATGEPGSDRADRMPEGALRAAPDLILTETANALWRKARIGSLTQTDAARASHEISRMFRRLVPSQELRAQALDLSRFARSGQRMRPMIPCADLGRGADHGRRVAGFRERRAEACLG